MTTFNEEDRKWLYDTMQSKGVDTGSYDDFKNSLNNDEDRQWYYDKSKELGLDVGSRQDFDDMMWEKPQGKESPVQSKAQPAAGVPDGTPYSDEVMKRYHSPDNKAGNYKDLSQIAAEVAAEGGQAYTQAAGTPVADDKTPGSDLWRKRAVAIPGHNPYNGKTYGEVYDSIIQDFGKNINHPDIDPYAEARAQIIQAGITDDLKPEEADKLALDIREGYANRFAGNNAQAIVSQLPDQVPNIDQLMDGMWYNREMQDKISRESRRLGLSHENYVNFYMKPQIAKALSDRYGYDVNSAKHIAGRLLSGEQHTMERVRQGEANEMITRYAEPLVQPYFDRVFKDADQTFDRQLQTAQGSPTGGAGATMGASLNYYNNTDPVKVWGAMKPHIEEMARNMMNQDFILEADKRADEEGVTIDEWLKGRIEPYLLSGIQAKFEQMALEHEMPKNTMDYLMDNIRQSIIGQIGNLILSSKARRRMQAEALVRTEMGQGDYKPGFGARVAGGVAAMLPDMMMYGGPFGIISKFATKRVQGMAQYLIADGMRPLFARMLQSSAQGALSLGAFESVKGGFEGWRNARYDNYLEDDQRSAGEILQDIVQGAYEHGMQSGIMGATMIGGPLGQKISNGRGVLANVAGWGTQVGVDAATATALNVPKLISGEITMENLGNEFAQNVGTFAALGLNHKAKEFASLANGGRAWNGVAFTKKDIDILEDRWLLPFRKQIGEIEDAQNRHGLIEQSSLGIDASQELRDATNSLGAEMYRDLMHSYAVPRELKVKVSQALGVPIPEYALKPEVLQLEKDATAKSIDLGWIDAMNYDHNKPGGVGDKVNRGEPLDDSELTLRLLFQDNKAFNEALLKQQSGEQLTEQEQELVDTNQQRMQRMMMEYAYREQVRLARMFEEEHGLERGAIARMMRDAAEGKAVKSDLLNEYENMLRQYNSELDAAEAQRDTQQSSSAETPAEEVPVAEAPVEEAPKVNRVEDEAPVEEVTDFTNKTTGTVMEVDLIDGRKAFIVDGDPSDMNSMLSFVDEQGKPITMQDASGYTHDRFPPEIIKADDKGMPVIRESVSEGNGDVSKPEEPAAASAKPGPVAEEAKVEDTALSRIPVDEKGEQVWEKSTPEDTVAALRETLGDDNEIAAMVDEEIADLESQLKELTAPAKGKDKKHSNMNERLKKKQAIKDVQQKLDHWNQVKEAMKSAEPEHPVEEPTGEAAVQEPEKPLEPEQPSEPQQSEQPAGPTAEQKIAQGTVKNNIGKRFGFQNPDGTRSEIVIDDFKGDDLVTVTRQDYDMNGQPKGNVYQQDLKLTDVGNSIVNGLIKPALTTKEKLAKNFKVTVGDIPLIDVLTEAEQQQLLDLYAKNDKEAIGRLTGDLMDAHHEDLILKGRDNRNQKVDQILNSNSGREQKLRQLRQLYNGDIVDSYLSDDALFPASPEEWVSELNSRVPKSGEGPLAYFSYDKDGSTVVGMQDETGFGTKSGGDNKGYAPWLAPKGKGISLQRYGEVLHSQLPENLQEQYSVQDMRNAVRDVFGSAERPSDIPTMVIRRGILQAENAARRMEEQWIEGGPSFHKVTADDSSFAGRLERAKQQTNTEPTEAQKEKGNYKKGHVSFGGYDFVIENPEGSMRRGESDGKKWEQKMNNTYGYILGKYGKDGDHLDMFINDAADLDNWNGKVYVVDQVNPKTGEFDEHKVMYGFDSEAEARDAYLSNYEKGWKGLGKITGVDKNTFDSWLDSSKRKRIPFAEHSIPREAIAKQEKKPVTDAEIDKALMQEVMKAPAEKGVHFVTDTDKGQRVLDEANGNATLSRSKKRAIETASLNPKEGSPADISTADGAKIQKKLESYANKLEKVSNLRKNFLDELAVELGATSDGSKSKYATFITKNGDKVTVRLGNHNATVSTFDFRGENNGISIVVSRRDNNGVTNDGNAHIVEAFYPEIALRKAYGKPLAEIVRSINEALDSGIYNDTTGLAEMEEVNADEIKQQKVEAPVFISNALQAVEGIKQEKGTAEQWLAMIQKNGGLKSGEDKWLGLSEWLNEHKGEKLTKQDVLDFIRQNQVQVEETHYSEFDEEGSRRLADFNKEFDAILDKLEKERNAVNAEIEAFNQEMYEKYDQGWVNDRKQLSKEDRQRDRHISNRYSFLNDNDLDQLAFADMVEKYGDDFGTAFEVNYNGDHYELIPAVDFYDEPTEAAKRFLQTQNDINGTRLVYTTDGLHHKREIALTVPTVEPYNESDSVHFGDAGGGRTVAWVRFGDTEVKVGVEPKVVTEFEAPYRNANGMEVYYPKGEKYGVKDYIVNGKIRTGEDKYVIVMNEKQVAAYDTFDEARDAMNQWYKDNNVGKPITGKVLVLDEIQSKRHQDARNQGYSNTEEIKRLEGKLDELIKKQKEVTEKEKAIYDEIAATDEVKAMLDKNGVLKPEYQEEYNKIVRDNEELQRLSREWAVYDQSIRATRDDITYEKNNGVPDAPFEKNWHELAMKRMLRYAAENGYDKVAWTTGEQQAERYNIGNVVEKIISYDYPEVNDSDGRKTKKIEVRLKNGETMTMRVAQNGMVIEGRSDTEGKNLADVVGKDLAKRIMGGEGKDGTIFDANKDLPAKVIEGDGLRIGAEGMAGFYDEILPRFINKYGKKWGVKVGEVELPGLEKSAQKMWSIDVTPEMKESVMQGQPMFFKTPDGQAYGFTYKGKIYVDPRIATSETPIHEYGHLWAEMKRQSAPEEWNNIKQALLGDKLIEPFIEKVKREYPELTGEGREDDFVEEVLTQYSGKHGAEKLRKMAQEIKAELGDDATAATIAEAAVRRVKSILNDFWKGVCDLMGWQYTNAEDVADAVLRDMLNGVNPNEERVKAGRGRANRADGLKQRQLDTILKENPADDENMPGHTWIRTINDIKTFREAVDEDGYAAEEGVTPDFTADMVKDALDNGVVIVYSSKPIKDGAFVTPSKMEATNYAGGGKVYSKEVPLTDVAWIDPLQGQYAKVSDNIKSQKVDYSSEEEQKRTKTIFDATKKLFGTTYDIREAGYVLPDGTMPDFSGRHHVDNASIAADLRGRRTVDHRDIKRIAYERDGNTETGIETDMPDFIRRGAIRIGDNAGAINLSVKPTNEQKKVLRQLISRNDGYVQVDFGDGWDSDHYVEYDGAKPSRVLADIDRYFDEGIKPLGDAPKYQLVGRRGAEKADEAEGTTMRQDNMKVAEEMEKAGKDIRAIKLATGWERGKDGQWRYETVDADVDVLKKYEDRENDLKSKGIENPVFVLRLGKLLGDDNVLFKYYPEMRFTEVLFDSTMDTNVAGSADGENIAINSKLAHRFDNHELDNESMYGTLLHEVQHIIQAKEGFAQGGSLSTATTEAGMEAIMNKKERQRSHILKQIEVNRKILNSGDELEEYAELGGFKTVKEYREHLNGELDDLAAKYDTLTDQIDRIYKLKTVAKSDAADLYRSLAGEVEARNVTERIGMSDAERRNNPAAKTEDVSREDQVVILDKGESNSIKAGTDRQSDTHSDNFKNFFGDWEKEPEKASKVVDKDGEPMVVYHQTGNDFTVFDPRHKGAGTNDYQLPFGIFMKPSARSIGVGGDKQMALYANIRKPLRVANRQELSRLLQSKVEGYKEALAEYERIDQEYSKKFDEAMKYDHERDVENWNKWKAGEITEEEYQNAISDTAEDVVDQWKEAQSKPIAKMKELVDDYFKNSEYDGIWIAQDEGSLGRTTETIIAFEPNQVKSATENNGDYNPENPDIRFQRVSPDSEMTPENEQYWKQWDAAMKKWKERNALPMDAQEPTERPAKNPDESMMDYVLRLANYNREKALWQTAPKLEDYHMVRDDKKVSEEARENEKRYPESEHAKRWRIATDLARIRHAMSRQKTYDKATVKAVTDFAQDFMRMGFGDNLRRGEMERMLSAVKNATGAKDIKKHVDAIMNILVDNQLRNLDQQIVKLSSIKELRQTAQGVERQGKLELKGQKMIQSFRETRESRMTVEEIKERMAEVMENIVKHPDSDDMWEQEYEGLVIALQYAENIDGSRQEFKALDDEYKDAVKSYKESGRSYQAQQELLESLDKAMLENKMERIGSFGDIIGRLEGNIAVSIEGAKEFLEREKQRVKHIQEMANFDLAGKDMGAQRKDTKGKPANFFLQPLATFEQMLKQFGSRNANGEGYLYNYFMRNWMDATDKAYLGEKQAKDELDEKAREVFGDKVKRWSDLYKIVMGLPTMDVEVADQGDKKTFTLTQGNLLYIYMANKMNDGAMKLRKMGIDEETVERIKDFLDPRLVELGDWLQDEYLPGKRVAYNKVHERMFGAPMAAIDHYFPIKILSDARVQEQDVNVPDSETLPSTITGNIIKRRKNALPLDILNTDALSLAIEHIEDMEHWAAQAEWNRDVNALLSYTTFRNKVKNMKTIYGSGDALWNTFKDAAKMAAGTYNSSAKSGHIDKTISNIAKGVTAAKISFRVYTAFKQTLSAPAFLHDVDLGKFAKYSVNPYGSWKWAMENMPVFRKRWESRQVGDTRLMDDPTDWKMWKNDVVQLASRWGMSPNALVDGVTCAVGARAIYESRLEKYQKMGVDEETAKKRALQDAEIGYNLTQQSSEGAFVSAIQKDRTVAANMLSVFRNSSMAYTRQWVDASRNLKHRLQKGYKEDSIGFMQKQFEKQFGIDEEQARQLAEAEYARAGRHDVARLLNMMFGVTIAWNLGASLLYLLIGDDDDTKEEMLKDAILKGMIAGPTEGFAAGNIVSDFVGRTVASEETRKTLDKDGIGAAFDSAMKQGGDFEINPLPLMSDIQGMIGKLGYDKYAALQDIFNICMQSAVGVNPQTFTDMYNAIMDYAAPGWDGTKYTWNPENMLRAKELALFIMRLANAPTSSWRNKYIDELDMDVEDAKKLSYDEMARRYAHYKHWKDAPITGWLRGEEGRQEKMEKIRKQFDKAYKERMDRQPDSEIKQTFEDTSDADIRKQISKLKAKSMEAKDAMGTTTSKDERTKEAVAYYAKHRTWQDMLDDLELEVAIRKLPKGDKKRKALERYNKEIKDLRNSLGRNAEEDSKRMESIRQARDKALQIVHNE